jgi:hypothetical protein
MRTIDAPFIFYQDSGDSPSLDRYSEKDIQSVRSMGFFEFAVFNGSHKPNSFFSRRQLYSVDGWEGYAMTVAIEIKTRFLKIPDREKVGPNTIISLLRDELVEIIPVKWGALQNKSLNVLSVRMNRGGNHYVLLNMDAPAENYEYMLAIAYGHFISIEDEDREAVGLFAHNLAWYLLNSAHPSSPAPPESFSDDNREAIGSGPTVGELLCKSSSPDARAIQKMAKENFGTRFFDAITFLQMHSTPSPTNTTSTMTNRIASALCMDIADAEAFSRAPGLTII